MTTTIIALIFSLLFIAKALWDMFRSRPSALWLAWLAMIAIRLAPVNVPLWSTIIFWGAACAIALTIGYMLPRNVSESRVGLSYFSVGAIVGAAVGYVVCSNEAGLIIGAVVGTLLSAVAFSRTPAGKPVAASLRPFANYLLAKGVYVVVIVDVVAIAVINFVNLAKTL